MGEARHVDWECQRDLPQGALNAHTFFVSQMLPIVREAIEDAACLSLTVALPPAGSDHDGWRKSLAGDLARTYAPKRVNIAGGEPGAALDRVLDYLKDAPGVTGHYVQAHD
ncbi:hypothetical protein NAP1_02080 [Erythrobacter sp. NAP1]|uniref:Rossmann fold domain-containing protein n=1 Tax=Erythrobacter sp. NAP1 TaxID=237727 RepID=UPI0000686CAD|nr:hypothetical protein [Erythrobacter sp. NAP1]EAQ29522.1 hypothetical protein NAP1_02080 [Erythrobacter sp. NAP1]